MKITITLFIYSLFTAEAYTVSDPFFTEENYIERVKKECKGLFDMYPQLIPQRYAFPRFTQVRCNYTKYRIPDQDQRKRMRRYYEEGEQHYLGAYKIPEYFIGELVFYECDISQPIYSNESFVVMDCGRFDDNCTYRQAVYKSYHYERGMKFIVLDGARIVKRIK
ncbi:hypothetical protein M514_03885, partial [Trichuris suis]